MLSLPKKETVAMRKSLVRPLFVLSITIAVAATPALALPAAATTIQVVQDPAKLAQPWAGIVQKGDFFISDGKTATAISTSPRTAISVIYYGNIEPAGLILGFLPEGASKRAATQIGAPAVTVAGQTVKMGAVTVQQEGAGILVQTMYEGPGGVKLEVRTRFGFVLESGRINITSEIRNAGRSEVKGLSFNLGANTSQSYNFSPYQAQAFPKLNFRVWQRPDHVLGWYNPNPTGSAANPVPGKLGAGQVYRASYVLVTGTDPGQVTERLYALAGEKTERAAFELTGSEGLTEVVIKETASGVVFYRTFMDKPAPLSVPLMRGTYTITANFFPAVAERNFRMDEATAAAKPLAIAAPKIGKLRVSIADKKGKPVLGKVSFIGLAPDRSPYFRPENPIATGRGWEQAKNSVFPLREKLEVSVPAGTYLVTASCGPEYTRESRVAEVFGGENPALDFRIDKVVGTAGLVSIDPHMHTQFSDGSMLVPERLKSVAGEGIEVVVSADHNFITDYRPDLERLGIGDELAVILGEEITARGGSIHYNAYPVERREGEPGGGAISVADVTPDVLFGLTRAKDPGAVVQVNHPRSRGLGYFLTYDLEDKTAATAKAPFSMDFDVMEIMNGSKYGGNNQRSVEDWFHLLNRGYPVKAVGSSDAHNIDGGEPTYSRTYVMYAGKKGAGLDQAAVVKAIKEGRSFVSNGPIVTVKANGGGRIGDLVRAKKGKVELDVKVESAPWVDVSEVRLVVNGERKPPLKMEGGDGKTVRFKDEVDLTLERDAWITVEVRGKSSLFPVLQQRAAGGEANAAAFPYAMTNPIFFDVDGDGKCSPVWAEKIKIK
jgi:hypothetical protein